MRSPPPLPSLRTLRALLGLVLMSTVMLLGAQAPRPDTAPAHSTASPERSLDILRLRQARYVSLDDPATAIPALIDISRGARDDDVRHRAEVLLLDSLARAPGAEAQELDAAIRYIYVSSDDPMLRERALLTLLARQLEELPEGAQGAFLAAILPQVLRSSQRHRLPPSVALAQAVLESGWGRSRLARDHHNLFGVKAGGSHGGITMPTQEHRDGVDARVRSRFRSFEGVDQSIEHHARLLGDDERYAPAREHWTDWRAFLQQIAPTYATDPAYARRVAQLVERYDLDRWDPLVQAAAVNDR
jgi:hypothetical protein